MRRSLFLILVVVVAIWFACQKLYVYLTNLKPTKMTCREFLDGNSSKKWVELTDCDVDYLAGTTLHSLVLKVDKGSFIPVRPSGSQGPARLLLKIKTEDAAPRLLAHLQSSKSGNDISPTTETVKGLVLFGLDGDEKSRNALDSEVRAGKLQSDFIIIEDGASPDPGDALIGGAILVALGLVLWAFFKGRRNRALTIQTPPPLPSTNSVS